MGRAILGDEHDLRRVHLVVSGQVQGVFFRATTREQAAQRGLTGWVRNTRDGNVEAEVQGHPAAVDELIDECRTGPPAAKVDEVSVDDIPVVPNEGSFEVEH